MKDRLKDWGRAYFNRSIHRRLRGDGEGYRPRCGALSDFFFVDPCGNVSPCNGSKQEWVIGNLRDASLEEILRSPRAAEVMRMVEDCHRNCAFIVTERHDMVRRPWKPIWWVLKNKWRVWRNLPLDWE